MTYWDGVLTGLLLGSVVGVVATIGAEIAVVCLAYVAYRALIRVGVIKVETVQTKSLLEVP